MSEWHRILKWPILIFNVETKRKSSHYHFSPVHFPFFSPKLFSYFFKLNHSRYVSLAHPRHHLTDKNSFAPFLNVIWHRVHSIEWPCRHQNKQRLYKIKQNSLSLSMCVMSINKIPIVLALGGVSKKIKSPSNNYLQSLRTFRPTLQRWSSTFPFFFSAFLRVARLKRKRKKGKVVHFL